MTRISAHRGQRLDIAAAMRARAWPQRFVVMLVAAMFMIGTIRAGIAPASRTAAVTGFDWTTYNHDSGRSGFTSDASITTQNASTLASRSGWPAQAAGGAPVSAQPIVANGLVYWGSWDGVEHATPIDAGTGWERKLGTLTFPPSTNCAKSGTHGVGDAGVIAKVRIVGHSVAQSVLFIGGGGNDRVGGGFAKMYALDALSGAILWQTDIAPAPNNYLWSSPALYKPSGQSHPMLYEGVSGVGEPCLVVPGEVIQIDALTGNIVHTLYTAPSGCTGGSVWGSPTVDPAANAVYVVTGNRGTCNVLSEPYAYAIVKLDASTLAVVDTWQLPKSERTNSDDDFGSTPILFSGTVIPNGSQRQLVGVANKNGVFYVWDRSSLSAGPVARITVAKALASNIAPAAFDGTRLYVGTRATVVDGTTYQGSLLGFNPNDLSTPLWRTTLPGQVLASVTAVPGIVIAGVNHNTVVFDATNGKILRQLPVKSRQGTLWSAPIVANGVLYEGDSRGYLYAYSPAGV